MKVLKYIKDNDNYCYVQKTKIFIHYLLYTKNNFFYYFTLNPKNYSKTNLICKRFLKSNDLKIELSEYDSFDLINKYNNYKYKTDYNIITSVYGEENFNVVKIFKKNQEIISFKEINKTPTFIYGYIFHKFNYKYSATFHGALIENYASYYKKHPENKIHLLIFRYYKYLTHKYIRYNFNIRSNFELLQYCDKNFKDKYYFLIYSELDKLIKINKDKILKKFKINNENELFGYIYFYNNYLFDFYYQYYLQFIDDKKSNISMTACAFNTDKIYNNAKDIMIYDILTLTKLNFKKYLIFFIEERLNKYLFLIKEDTIRKRNEKIIKNYLDKYVK